jgi:hypothetical protein
MSRLDELPPDQRAALSLLLRQRKSYAEVAVLLGIGEAAVHDRAHAALAVLAPREARGLVAERRAEIADYMLGQQTAIAERLKTRTYLSSSEPAAAWARALAAELAPIGAAELPEIPATAAAAVPPPHESIADLSAAPRGDADTFGGSAQKQLPSSRTGGALLLGAIVVVVVVAVILLSGGSSHSKSSAKSTTATSTSTSTSAESSASTKTTGTGPTVDAQLPIKSPDPKSRSVGVVEVLSEKGKRAFYIAAEQVPATTDFFYAVWLYNSHTSAEPLSKAPAVGKTHKLAGGALLPSNAGDYREILLTRETSDHPTHPGLVVLRGAFSLGS